MTKTHLSSKALEGLSSRGIVDAALEYLSRGVDDLLDHGDFEGLDRFVGELKIDNLDPQTLVGILRVTSCAREALPTRPHVVLQIRERLTNTLQDPRAVQELLRGLE